MTLTTTMLTAFLAIQASATVEEPTLQESADATPMISLPEESTGTATQPIAESTWQNTEIELLMRKARESLQEDRYPEALDLYIAASDRRPLDERLQYNLGVAAYRAGDLDVATRAFERASSGDDPEITQSALYNRGNVSYRRALDLVEQARNTQSREMASEGQADPETLEQPIDALEQALSHYRDAIIASPDSKDARRNAELAHRLMKALEETQEEQQQQQDQQEQEQQEQDQQNQDQQEQDQQNQDQQEQDEQEQDEQEQDSKDSKDESDEDSANSANSANKETAPVRMTREQAEALLQMIRDKEKERREVLAAREAREAARKKTPVEKDW